MRFNLPAKKLIPACLGLFLLSAIFTPDALAGRYVLNQTPQTIQSYFGLPLSQRSSWEGENLYTHNTYSVAAIRRLFPSFPKAGRFEISFINNRVQHISLSPNASENENFTYDPQAFFNYIFGYEAPILKKMPLPNNGGGHEGFMDNKVCLGDGVGSSWMSYLLGDQDIDLYYDPECEPPYK